eukprot:CAMPEP_0175039256 /NCGR_PEP_ID=MMETSP0052_2-20121109/446_1 /TAXON_ID=51329 ORGANISM="Polytomella parva, Strain SAG 63-3" /NCGR_SAMPLE_ID=MMETSP0052_2 /ASSEMBLY_ACC=CAM_ASM_000194 /LENGTH=192 /DNA_ID=CAMNT_0016301015 /DNA_START=399 /DNA_END=977 /DNA_ORIENTATION=+
MLMGHPLVVRSLASDFTKILAIKVVDIRGDFLFDPVKKEDFLDAVIGLDISPDEIGDVILRDLHGAQIVATPEAASKITESLTDVIGVAVKCQAVPLSELAVAPLVEKTITSTEASMRLDAIASAGFGISRSKAATDIKEQQVRVNWKHVTRVADEVKQGDVIALEGRGKVTVVFSELTKKGRYQILLKRIS